MATGSINYYISRDHSVAIKIVEGRGGHMHDNVGKSEFCYLLETLSLASHLELWGALTLDTDFADT